MLAFIIISVFVISLIISIIAIMYSAEEFPDYYNPACFDCNKGGESCPTCKYLDPEYRDPEEIRRQWNAKINQEFIDKQ